MATKLRSPNIHLAGFNVYRLDLIYIQDSERETDLPTIGSLPKSTKFGSSSSQQPGARNFHQVLHTVPSPAALQMCWQKAGLKRAAGPHPRHSVQGAGMC